MNRYRNLLLFTGLAITFAACKSFEGAAIDCSPDPLEVHADSTEITIKASLAPKAGLKKGGVYVGEAKIGGVSVKKVVFDVTEKADFKRIKKFGLDTSFTFKRAFKDQMDGNSMVIEQSYERKGKEYDLPAIEGLCNCCITTSRLVGETDPVIFSKHKYVKEVPINLSARFNFPKDVYEIQEGDYNKSDIKAIGDFISKKYPATKITIMGVASPEGPYDRNVMLSVNRSKEVQAWLTEQLKAAGYEAYLDSNFFDINVNHEDWEGFKASLNTQNYPEDVKRQIIEIVSAGLDEDERERQVMALVGGKDKVENILAPLRRATIKVEGFEPRRTDAEIDQIASDFVAGKFSGSLKTTFEKEEWLYAISRQSDFNAKKALLEAYRDAYPSDVRAFNDLGAIAIAQGNFNQAMDYLEKAERLNSNDAGVQNNLGLAYLKKGKYKDAKSALEKSLSVNSGSPEANFNMGVVLEKMAQYSRAVEKFNNATAIKGAEYNAGLCKLLMGDNSGAKASLNQSISKYNDHAPSYYVSAIAGARSSDMSNIFVNLKKACQLDASYKQKAANDLEFKKYWDNSEFKAAIQ